MIIKLISTKDCMNNGKLLTVSLKFNINLKTITITTIEEIKRIPRSLRVLFINFSNIELSELIMQLPKKLKCLKIIMCDEKSIKYDLFITHLPLLEHIQIYRDYTLKPKITNLDFNCNCTIHKYI